MRNFTKVQNSAEVLRGLLKNRAAAPRVGFVLGTGLGGVADLVEDALSVPFADLPDFPLSGVASHAGRFIVGKAGGVPVIVQQGRCHLYEGRSPAEVCMGTRVMAALGITTLIVTNAAGSVNPLFEAGDVMVLSDHINFTGASPLTGPNDEAAGPRFPDMSAAYDKTLIALAEKAALRAGVRLEKGVYLGLPGPQLETPAESRAFRLWGADAIGMSTVLEVIAARHLGLAVLGFSCLSNKNLPDCMAETSLEEIIRVAEQAGMRLTRILEKLLEEL
ncbi:MAG: purine-nucleoside phosphorylase [Deltaproteobacteria bacterium]|jgi:purine-nucleoside phosphorylase|nr:purine-nucleoside phosphorylase [Deltaproteobacteria bacterium]